MDMSPQHIRLMEVAEILRRASDERTSSLTSETSRLRRIVSPRRTVSERCKRLP